ncbi:ATP-binding protein [Streptomyces sp. NPDC092046]|uniref:ATP-binding protein n=1 Tax=Streptomyces sp. NPDC092046 TaxID=3366009 RepID=UPI00382739F7
MRTPTSGFDRPARAGHYKQFLLDVLQVELADRDLRRQQRLLRLARFPRPKRLEDFDFAKNPNVAPEVVADLKTPTWVREGRPLVLIGDSGTGKSHLLIGIGTAIAETGLSVRYATTSALGNELAEADANRRLSSVIARYSKIDLLCLDEFGYLNLDRKGAKLLFQIFTEREERKATAVARNSPLHRVRHDLRRRPPLRGPLRPDHLPLHPDPDRHRVLPLPGHPGIPLSPELTRHPRTAVSAPLRPKSEPQTALDGHRPTHDGSTEACGPALMWARPVQQSLNTPWLSHPPTVTITR